LNFAPPPERPLARRARDDPRTPGVGRLAAEAWQMEQLERIVTRWLPGLGPGDLDAVARTTLDVGRSQHVVDRPDTEPVAHLVRDRPKPSSLRAFGLEQLDRQQVAVLVRGERIGQRASDRGSKLAMAIHPLAGDAIANVHEVRTRRPEVFRDVAARRPRARAG